MARADAVSVIVPVLGRPASAQPLAESLAASDSELDLELLFVCSPGDDDQIDACSKVYGAETVVAPWPIGTRGDYARKINLGLWLTDTDWLFCGADDVRFRAGWAEAAVAELERTQTGFCGTNDLANPKVKLGRHATHPLVRRSYALECGTIDAPGLIYHEGYWHQFVDNEATGTAMIRGCWSFARDSVVEHRHPIYDRSVVRDETYELGDLHRVEDHELHERQARIVAGMRITHLLRVLCRCPVDDTVDVYDVTVTTDHVVPVEAILAIAKELWEGPPRYQEDVTLQLAQRLGTEVETVGVHSGVVTTVVVDGRE